MLFLFLVLAGHAFLVHSLILNQPLPGTGYSGILSNGTAFLSWIAQAGDPSFITFEIQNNLTLDSWEFARNVSLSLGNITRTLDDVSGNEYYFMQAVQVENLTNVLAESPLFTVDGRAVTTTNPIPSSTASPTTTSVIIPNTSTNLVVQETGAPKSSGSRRGGAIAGGVVGGVVLLAFIAAAAFFLRRYQRRRHHSYPTVVPLAYETDYRQPAEDKSDRLAEVLSEKGAAQRQRDRLRMNLEAQQRGTQDNNASSESETRLRQQVGVMSERILELERQQRELELYQGRLFGEENQPPPDYSDTPSSSQA